MSLHLVDTHALAPVASRNCTTHTAPLVGGVACGACWEQAIRDDERFAVENDLPRELVADPSLIDDVAVSRAVSGHFVVLTAPERTLAITRLRNLGASPTEISRILHANYTTVLRILRATDTSSKAAGAA